MPAAKAAYCAGQQKPAYFWSMHDWLFANQGGWSGAAVADASKKFRDQAVSLGVDGAKYDACVAAPETQARIQKDMDDGEKLGVQGTPAFFVNDWFLNGAVPFSDFQSTIEQALTGKHPPPSPTPLPAGVQFFDADPNRPGMTYSGNATVGDAKASVVLISFENFKCQGCAQFSKDVAPTLRDKYIKSGQVRWVFFFAEPTQGGAPNAAQAGLCALDQGKFWEYHDTLFAHQAEWQDMDQTALVNYAKGLGLDADKLSQCLSSGAHQTQVENDTGLAQNNNVSQLPYFIILNASKQTGTAIAGAPTLATFEQKLQSVLNPGTPAPAAQPTASK